MNSKNKLKIVKYILIIIAMFLLSSAWFYDGIVNKVGFVLFGLYILWVVIQKPKKHD